MYGWRGKIGVLVPSINSSLEYEFNKMAPVGVSILATRLRLKEGIQGILRMSEELEKAAEDVASVKVDIILFGCTSGSFIKGVGYDREIIERIENHTGVRATTTSTAVVEALKELELKNIAVVTPYAEEIDKMAEKFLRDSGFNVVSLVGGWLQAERMTSFMAYKRAKAADSPDAEGIFISCTNFQTIEIIEKLENALSKPVISANQSSMWNVLKRLRIEDTIVGYGSLLKGAQKFIR